MTRLSPVGRRTAAALGLGSPGLAGTSKAQVAWWQRGSTSPPESRVEYGAAFSSLRSRMVLHGGLAAEPACVSRRPASC